MARENVYASETIYELQKPEEANYQHSFNVFFLSQHESEHLQRSFLSEIVAYSKRLVFSTCYSSDLFCNVDQSH